MPWGPSVIHGGHPGSVGPRARPPHETFSGEADEAAGLATGSIRARPFLWAGPWSSMVRIRRAEGDARHGLSTEFSCSFPGGHFPARVSLRAWHPPPPRSAVGFTEQEGYPPGSCLLPVGCPLAPLWSAASVSCRGEHDRFRPLPGCFVGHRCPHLERACRVAATLGQIIGGSSNRQSSEGDRYNRSNAGVLCDLGLSHDLFIRIRTGVHRTLG